MQRAAIPLSPLVRQYQLNPHLKRKDGAACTPEPKDRRAHMIYEICDDIVCSNNCYQESLSCPKELLLLLLYLAPSRPPVIFIPRNRSPRDLQCTNITISAILNNAIKSAINSSTTIVITNKEE